MNKRINVWMHKRMDKQIVNIQNEGLGYELSLYLAQPYVMPIRNAQTIFTIQEIT